MLSFLLLGFLYGCAGGPELNPDPSNPVRSVAVLPLYNLTNDVGGAEMVRKLLIKNLKKRQYAVMSRDEVDSLLQERMGISLGSQLDMTTYEDINKVLEVDALLYGYLLDFDDVIFGIYNTRSVRAGFKMVDTSTGAVIWSGGKGIKTLLVSEKSGIAVGAAKDVLKLTGDDLDDFSEIEGIIEIPGLADWQIVPLALGEMETAAVFALGTKVLGKVFGVHMMYESDLVVRGSLSSLSAGPGR